MFKKILVANRSEIAVRIVRACRDLGIATVVVYSTADRDSLAVRISDESVCVGPPKSGDSYLNQANILSAAIITGAEAIHPGYGFLAENAGFVEKCDAHGLIFIGPTGRTIELLGDKVEARKTAVANSVPLLPGSDGELSTSADALACAERIGYPVLLKAAAGGGGRGMRIVRAANDLAGAMDACRNEASTAFGNPAIYMEKYVVDARHIEVQVLGDDRGTLLHLGERDCSIQRRHQKLIEEAPGPAMTPSIRADLTAAAVRLCAAVGYRSAGTVEFVMDTEGNFYFLEVNTRIQVEHPVTEMVTGIDLVKEQIRVAAGEPLRHTQADIRLTGHAIECRITAEDPETFTPFPGRINECLLPGGPGIRVDSHAYAGYVIPPDYDSLVAKIIAYGADRTEAIARMRRAFAECVITGVKTTVPFHLKVLDDPRFLAGGYSTSFIDG